MESKPFKLKEFLSHHNIEQIIIPEIQRDYVWKEQNVIKLLTSIKENADRQNDLSNSMTNEDLQKFPLEVRKVLERTFEDTKSYCNIGFIYAYHDVELPGRLILIDGQQRMTTIFLLILALCIRENKVDYFRRIYFKDGNPKFDYKVREDAHEFFVHFIEHLLNGSQVWDVKDRNWYYDEYRNDVTIQSVFANYITIEDYLRDHQLSLDYIEQYIEFWYFNINKSSQGEELYIYMNSRGESVSPNESIKAGLLKGKSELEKHEWGTKWERWQNFFWLNKGGNTNADRGFEAFLKFLNTIDYILTMKEDSEQFIRSEAVLTLREIRESRQVLEDGLTLPGIERYFKALELLVDYQQLLNFKAEWLEGKIKAVEYVKLIPVLMYAEKYPEADQFDIQRFAHFFYNITNYDLVSKNPYITLINSVLLTQEFLDQSFTDVADLVEFSDNAKYDNILFEEEVIKLKLYRAQSDPDLRSQMEQGCWAVEDNPLFEGRVAFIWDCMDYKPSRTDFGLFDLELFKTNYHIFQMLYSPNDDLIKRALLTKGDYSFHDGRTSKLSGDRYSFHLESQYLSRLIRLRYVGLKSLLTDFLDTWTQEEVKGRDTILQEIIDAYLLTADPDDWKCTLVKYPEMFAYCRQKLICFSDDGDVYLLKDRYAGLYNFEKMSDYLPKLSGAS